MPTTCEIQGADQWPSRYVWAIFSTSISKDVISGYETGNNSNMLDTSISDTIRRLRALYEMSDELSVKRVADSNQLLTQMLESLPNAIQPYFPEARLALDVFCDPEEDVSDKINVRIRTQLSPSQAVARRAEMIEQWFVPFLKETGDVPVIFTLERLR